MTTGMAAAMRERRKTTTVLALLLLSAGLTLGLAREAISYTFDTGYDRGARNFYRDSDGYVPETKGDLNGYVYNDGWTVYGYTTPYISGGTVKDYIKYDFPAMNYCRVPGWKVYNHERAHSRGWAHRYGTPYTNAAYYGNVQNCSPA